VGRHLVVQLAQHDGGVGDLRGPRADDLHGAQGLQLLAVAVHTGPQPGGGTDGGCGGADGLGEPPGAAAAPPASAAHPAPTANTTTSTTTSSQGPPPSTATATATAAAAATVEWLVNTVQGERRGVGGGGLGVARGGGGEAAGGGGAGRRLRQRLGQRVDLTANGTERSRRGFREGDVSRAEMDAGMMDGVRDCATSFMVSRYSRGRSVFHRRKHSCE